MSSNHEPTNAEKERAEKVMQKARESIKDKLEKTQEVIDLGDGRFQHRSHVVLFTVVDGVPLSTYLVINVKSKNKKAKIVMKDIIFDGNRLELKRDIKK